MTPTTEIHHVKEGVLVSWAHACGHLSNPVWYAGAETAKPHRERMEGQRCWDCRNAPA